MTKKDTAKKSLTTKRKATSRARSRVRVLLVDDHPLIREGIRSCLATAFQIEVVGEAAGGKEAVQRVRRLRPDLVLMDLNMPGMDGLAASVEILRRCPRTRLLVLTVHNQSEYIVEIIRSGAHGYVSKDVPPAELIGAIEKVARGGTHFDVEATTRFLRRYAPIAPGGLPARGKALTSREYEVLGFIVEGLGNRQISARLGIGVRTVETHRERMMRKLDIHNVAGLTRYALAHGIGERRSEWA